METNIPPSLDINEIQSIADPDVLREKLLSVYDQFERHRDDSLRRQTELEQELFEVQQQNENNEKKLSETSTLSNDLKQQLKILESERVERTRRVCELEGLHNTDETEKAYLKRQCENLLAEKASFSELLESKNEDIETRKGEIAALREELRALVTQLCEYQVKQGDLDSREIAIEHRENRVKEERELLLQEKAWLQGELSERDTAVQQLRQEINKLTLEHQTGIAAKDEELREVKLALDSAKTQCARFADQLEQLNKKMKEAADSHALKDESYEKELHCQTRLAQVYKQSADEAECKVEELASSLESVQQLFNDAKEQHFTVQEQMNQIRVDFEKEMTEKDSTITELRDELEKANELLRSKHRVMLTDEEVAALSPAAASASKLIKSGTSLTQIYRDHIKAVEELEMQKLENKRIEAYFRELVQEIEAKAPLLRKQQEDYSRSLKTVDDMKRQLTDVAKDQQKLLNEKDTLRRQMTYTRAELERYQRDNGDLSSQVRELLFSLERLRAGDLGVTPLDVCQQPSADDLNLFRNIDELQSKYQRLLSEFREAEARREEMVKAAQESEMSKIRAEIDGTLKEVEQLREQREKQNGLLQAIRDERDTYKRLLTHTQTERDLAVQKAQAQPPESETLSVKNAFEKLRVEFDIYRREKNEAEKLLQEKIDKYEATMSDLRSGNAKLNAEIEYQLERFKILSGNVDTYKKEITSFNERNERNAVTLAKYQQTVEHLTNDMKKYTEDLNRCKAENGRLQDQLLQSRSNEAMAQQELQIVRKDQQSQQIVSMTLQEMDARLKKQEADDTTKTKSDLDALTRERNYLQSNIKTLTEHSQEYVRECKAKIASLEGKVSDEQRQVEHLRAQLQWTEEQVEAEKSKALEFKTDLEGLQTTYQDASAGRFQKEAQQLQTRLNYLESRYTEAEKQIEELTQLLYIAQTSSQHYQKVSETLEEEMKAQKDTLTSERNAFETDLASYKSRLENFEAEEETRKQEIEHLQERLKDLQRHNEKVEELSRLNSALTTEAERLRASMEELQEKYEAGERRLSQARQIALKYRMAVQENENREKQLHTEIESLKEAQQQVDMEKKEIEARCNILEMRVKDAAQASAEPVPMDLSAQNGELLAQIEDLKQREEEIKRSFADAGQRLVAAQAEKKQLELTVEQLKEDTEKLEQLAEERKCRLDSLTSLHAQCENKTHRLNAELNALADQNQKLTAQFNLLSEQYQNDKANWDKQIQDAKASSRATPIQHVSAMPTGVSTPQPERPSPGPNHEQRTAPVKPSTRQTPVVANVRPIATTQRSTAPIPPTAISPGPCSYPDQSSSVTSLPSVPISVSPTVISSTQQSSTVGVPQAVVPPHIESGHGTVSASSDAFSDISSSVIITIEPPGTSEASASSFDIDAPVVATKRKPPQDPSDRATKRSRASSPEQVSTSEQHSSRLFGALPSLPEEIIESANVQAIVGSSLDEQGDDVIFVEEVERGIEPESTGQEQGDSSRASGGPSVAPTGATEMSQGRSTGQQPPMVAHYSIWDVGDDGIVPSTPTLVTRRGEQEIGGAAHVPQGRFSFGSFIQEPYPTSQFAAPAPDVTAHRSVPTTPRAATPLEADREPAPSSTIVDIVNLGGDQQPQPSGQMAEPEILEALGEEPDGSSEAVAATAEGAERGNDGGDEDSNEPTTSQPRGSRRGIRLNLNRPVTEEPQASGPVPGESFSEPATSTSGRPQARRGRGRVRGRGRGGSGRGHADQ